jgi:NADP-reducing hydrogenase subunit HndB
MSKKIRNTEELKNFRDRVKSEIELRDSPKDIQITVHMGTCGIAAGARDMLSQLSAELFEFKADNVTLRQSGCIGLCDREPMMTLTDKKGMRYLYGNLNKKKVHDIVQIHIVGGTPVMEYIITT